MNTDMIELFEADAQLLRKATRCDHGVRLVEDCGLCKKLDEQWAYWESRSQLFLND